MTSIQFNRLGLVTFSLAIFSLPSCKTVKREGVGETKISAVSGTGSPTETARFFEGLYAQPGSDARKAAGAMMEEHFSKIFAELGIDLSRPQKPSATDYWDFAPKERQYATARIVQNTIDYLKADADAQGNVCAPNEKIRMYRGTSAWPYIRPRGSKKGFYIASNWGRGVYREVSSSKNWRTGMPSPRVRNPDSRDFDPGLVIPIEFADDDFGTVIYESREEIKRGAFSRVDWKAAFGIERFQILGAGIDDSVPPETPFDFFSMSTIHTSNSEYSGNSPLISASMRQSVAESYAPGLAIIDICPERFQLLTATDFFYEAETYIPLFILPEEIVEVRNWECGVAKKWVQDRAKREGLWPESSLMMPEAFSKRIKEECFRSPSIPDNEASSVAKSCYINGGTKLELDATDPVSGLLGAGRVPFTEIRDRYVQTASQYYRSLLETTGTQAWRKAFHELLRAKCRTDCGLMKRLANSAIAAHKALAGGQIPDTSADMAAAFHKLATNYVEIGHRICPGSVDSLRAHLASPE